MKNYSEIRQTIRSGDLIVWTHRGIKNWHDFKVWCVTLFTRSRYTHVAMAWCIGGRVLVIEAVMPLVRIFPLSKLGDFYLVNQGFEWSDSVESLALSIVGQKYSQIQASQSLFITPKNDNLWQCAEFYATIANKLGANLGSVYTPECIVEQSLLRPSTNLIKVVQDT